MSISEMQELLDSWGRVNKFVDRLIGAVGSSGTYDGLTRDEALEGVRRFAQMVEKAADWEDAEGC